ncbi:MAG: LPP20 family lipoprotein [Myxococcales bacterium]
MKRMTMKIGIAVAALAAFGCASTPKVNEPGGESAIANEFDGAPVWVVSNCAKYLKKQVVCASGSFGGTRNPGLAKSQAEARGRTAIAQSLETKVKAMIKDYQSTTTGGADFGASANDEQHVENVSKQITNQVLNGTIMEESWISKSGTFYALMVLDVETFKTSVEKMGQLSEGLRQAVKARADRSFMELDQEIEKDERR